MCNDRSSSLLPYDYLFFLFACVFSLLLLSANIISKKISFQAVFHSGQSGLFECDPLKYDRHHMKFTFYIFCSLINVRHQNTLSNIKKNKAMWRGCRCIKITVFFCSIGESICFDSNWSTRTHTSLRIFDDLFRPKSKNASVPKNNTKFKTNIHTKLNEKNSGIELNSECVLIIGVTNG